jgi:hypothetical protein
MLSFHGASPISRNRRFLFVATSNTRSSFANDARTMTVGQSSSTEVRFAFPPFLGGKLEPSFLSLGLAGKKQPPQPSSHEHSPSARVPSVKIRR